MDPIGFGRSRSFSTGARSNRASTSRLLPSAEVADMLQLSASRVSEATSSELNSSRLVELSNSAPAQAKLSEELLPVYFYSWQLNGPQAVIAFLLLHLLVLWREGEEASQERRVYHEHAAMLKTRISELERRLADARCSSATDSLQQASAMDPPGASATGEAEEERRRRNSLLVVRLSEENETLKANNEELLRINQQWALDYQSMTCQLSSAKHELASPSPPPPAWGAGSCEECRRKEEALADSREQTLQLRQMVRQLQQEKGGLEEESRAHLRRLKVLASESEAVKMQLEELDGLRELARKGMAVSRLEQCLATRSDELARVQRALRAKESENQSLVARQLTLERKVRGLRRAFQQLFVYEGASTGLYHCSFSQPPSIPPHIHRTTGPTTPPGLLARDLSAADPRPISTEPPRAARPRPSSLFQPSTPPHPHSLHCPGCHANFNSSSFELFLDHIQSCSILTHTSSSKVLH